MAKEEYTKEDLISLREEGKTLTSATVSRMISLGTMFIYLSFIQYPQIFNSVIEGKSIKALLSLISLLIGSIAVFMFTFVLVSLLQTGFFFNFGSAFSPFGLRKSRIRRPLFLRILDQTILPVIFASVSVALSLFLLRNFSLHNVDFIRLFIGGLGGMLAFTGVISLITFRISMNKAVLKELRPDIH